MPPCIPPQGRTAPSGALRVQVGPSPVSRRTPSPPHPTVPGTRSHTGTVISFANFQKSSVWHSANRRIHAVAYTDSYGDARPYGILSGRATVVSPAVPPSHEPHLLHSIVLFWSNFLRPSTHLVHAVPSMLQP